MVTKTIKTSEQNWEKIETCSLHISIPATSLSTGRAAEFGRRQEKI